MRIRSSSARRGLVLVIVLVVVAVLSLAAYTFSELMLTEHQAARVSGRQVQGRALVDSGIDMLRIYLAQSPEILLQSGGTYDNAAQFQGVLVVDDGTARGRGRFSIVAPRIENGEISGVRFGLENESARLNLNALAALEKQKSGTGRQVLMVLPGMDNEIADAILDWLDADDTPRELGAEIDYYSGMNPPYAAKNGPLDTIEELLSVRGVTPELLFGADANRNGLIDTGEESRAHLAESYSADKEMDRGWAAYLTLVAKEANVQPDGTQRVDLNGTDLQKLHDDLSAVFDDEWVNFIIAYRQFGPYQQPQAQQGGGGRGGSGGRGGGGGGSGGGGTQTVREISASTYDLDLNQAAKSKFTQVLDLVGARVQIQQQQPSGGGQPGGGQQTPVTVLKAPFPAEPLAAGTYLTKLMDHVSVNPAAAFPGRININQASRTLLRGIPGMTDQIVDEILSYREPEYSGQYPERKNETWLYTQGIVTLDQMKALMPLITTGGSVYRAQIVGYFDEGGPATRSEVLIDASQPTTQVPRIVFWRDMTHLGRGFPVETLGIGAGE